MAHIEALLIILLSQLSTISYALLPKFTSILIFGDSLLDTGNNNFLPTLVKANHPPYGKDFPGGATATGRFSNGVLISDMLASGLGIKERVPPFLDPKLSPGELKTGVCFASAGSGYDERTALKKKVLPVLKQPDYLANYIKRLKGVVGEEEGNRIVNGSLAVVFSGSNDMLSSTRRLEIGLDAFDDFLLSKLTDFIKQIYEQGVRNVLVGDIPPLKVDAPSYNRKLKEMLPKLQSQLPGSKLVFADLSEALTEVLLKGFLRGTSIVDLLGQCCPGLCTEGVKACENADEFYRWDTIHPTQAVYRIVTDHLLQNAIPQFA